MPIEPCLKSPNFFFLEGQYQCLGDYATRAERYVFDDPNTSLLKLRQYAELLARHTAAFYSIDMSTSDFREVVSLLRRKGYVDREVAELFDMLRIRGNEAAHGGEGDRQVALAALITAHNLAVWFVRTFVDKGFKRRPFRPPPHPTDAERALKDEIEALREVATRYEQERASFLGRLEDLESIKESLESEAEQYQQQLHSAELQLEEGLVEQEAERQQYECRIREIQERTLEQTPEELRVLLARSRAAASYIGCTEHFHPPIRQIRIVGPRLSPCHNAPTLLVQATSSGIVKAACSKCGSLDDFRKNEFLSHDLWVSCPHCRKKMRPFKPKGVRRYAYQCGECNWSLPLSGLLPDASEVGESE